MVLAVAPRSRAENTAEQYAGPWSRITEWCAARDVSALPMDARVCALFLGKELRRCYQQRLGPSMVLTCSAAIHFHHWLCGFESPTTANFCAVVREVARRTLRTERAAKDTVSTEQVDTVIRALTSAGDLPSLVLAVAIALGFYGFLRASEILAICWKQIRFFESHMEIFISDSKTDQYSEGHWVVVAAADPGAAALCPVALARRLLERGGYEQCDAAAPEALLIRACSAAPKKAAKHVLRGPTVGIHYSTMLSKAKKAFAIIGVSPTAFAMHVLRVSGATEAARAMVPDRLRLNQGRWKSEITLRGYTRERLPIQVRVSKAMMGLLENGQAPEFI